VNLTIAELRTAEVEPPLLDETSPDTTVWRDGNEQAVAFSATRGEWHWFRVTGAGSFRFPARLSGARIECEVVPEAPARRDVVVDSYYRTVVPLALQAYGFEVLHGSAVALPGGVVAMCAERGTGKSTIAFALRQRGHVAVADDAVVVAVPQPGAASPVTVRALPFELRLRGPSATHFEAPSKRDVLVSAAGSLRPTQLPLAAVLMLARHDGPVELKRLGAREAFSRVLQQAYAFSLDDAARKRAMLGSYMRLVNLVPSYELAFPPGLEQLDHICARIESLAATAGAGQP